MGKDTSIEWADSTVNPVSGCSLCELWTGEVKACYAGQIHTRFSGQAAYPGPFEQVSLHPGRMAKAAAWPDLTGTSRSDKPWLDGRPRVVFLGDMSDVLSGAVPFEYLESEVVDVVASPKGLRHVWMLLTKRSHRLAAFASWLRHKGQEWPDNLWVGTSVTNQASVTRVEHLLKVPARVRYVSAEPLWGPVDLSPWLGLGIHLVIVGGQSGRDAKPFDLAWAGSLRDQCRAAGVAFFFKQAGSRVCVTLRDDNNPSYRGSMTWSYRDSKGGSMEEWPTDLRVREFPAVRP